MFPQHHLQIQQVSRKKQSFGRNIAKSVHARAVHTRRILL